MRSPFRAGSGISCWLGELPDTTRQVAYVAIGDSRGRGTYIGHFCTSVFNYRRDSAAIMTAIGDAVAEAGLGAVTGGGGAAGIFTDPNGIAVELVAG